MSLVDCRLAGGDRYAAQSVVESTPTPEATLRELFKLGQVRDVYEKRIRFEDEGMVLA